MKYLLIASFLLPAALLGGCQRNGGLAGRVDTEVKTKYVKTFDDPSSYEAVENKYDSVRYASYHRALLDSIQLTDKTIQQSGKDIKSCIESIAQVQAVAEVYGQFRFGADLTARAAQVEADARDAWQQAETKRASARQTRVRLVRDTLALARRHLTTKDIYLVRIKHLYRAKNKAGALQLGAYDFAYYPQHDSLALVRHLPDYTPATAVAN